MEKLHWPLFNAGFAFEHFLRQSYTFCTSLLIIKLKAAGYRYTDHLRIVNPSENRRMIGQYTGLASLSISSSAASRELRLLLLVYLAYDTLNSTEDRCRIAGQNKTIILLLSSNRVHEKPLEI